VFRADPKKKRGDGRKVCTKNFNPRVRRYFVGKFSRIASFLGTILGVGAWVTNGKKSRTEKHWAGEEREKNVAV